MKIFWACLLGLHVLVALFLWQSKAWYLADSYEYVHAAENLVEHGTLYSAEWGEPWRMHHYSKRPPVYPLLLAANQVLFGSPMGILFWQILLSMASLLLAWHIFGLLTPHRRASWWLLPFLLLYPAQFFYTQLVMTEILLQFLLLALLYLWLRLQTEGQTRLAWLITVLLVVAMLTKPVMYLFCLPHLVMMGYWAWQHKRPALLLPGVVPLLFVLLYAGWNEQRTGYYHFSSIQNLSLLQYTTHTLLTQVYGPDSALVLSDRIHYAAVGAPTYAEGQQLLQRECGAVIRNHLPQYALLHVKGMVHFFLDPGRFDLYHVFGLEAQAGGGGFLETFGKEGYGGIWNYLKRQPLGVLLLMGLIACFNLLKLLALLLLPFDKRLSWQQKFLLALLIVYIATLTGASGAARFALPVFPLLLTCVGLMGSRGRD